MSKGRLTDAASTITHRASWKLQIEVTLYGGDGSDVLASTSQSQITQEAVCPRHLAHSEFALT